MSSFSHDHNDNLHYWGVYFAPIDVVSEIDRIFSSLYFERTRFMEFKGTPESSAEALRALRDQGDRAHPARGSKN